jgi:hypothetical protein
MEYSQKYLLEKVKALQLESVQWSAERLVLESELESLKVRLSDSELELVRVKQKAHLRESELEMALDLAQSKVMALE